MPATDPKEAGLSSRRLQRSAVMLAALALLTTAGVLATAVSPTSAAWDDGARFGAAASSGTWSTTPTVGCTVVYLDRTGVETPHVGATCAVTGINVTTDSNGHADVFFSFSHNGTVTWRAGESADYYVFTADMGDATGLTAPWDWRMAGPQAGNVLVRSTCSAMPFFTGATPSGWGPQTSIWQTFARDRSAATGLTCS